MLVMLVTVLLGACALTLARLPYAPGEPVLPLSVHLVNHLMTALEIGIGLYVVVVGWRARRPLIVALTLGQAGLVLGFEWQQGAHLVVAHNLFVDKFSVTMALINGVVGGGICLYALGYMREYHEVQHREVADRRPLFFALMSVFLGAMFGIIFSNNLLWLYFFWEVTTLCSFLLIGYRRNEESQRNALRALEMNLMGGLAFAVAIVWFHAGSGSVELQTLLQSTKAVALIPAALLCLAGMTKSAQLPFSGWLLGAMVAPTPVSALLHSSTMVKAGVYLVLRLAPVVSGTAVGTVVALVGAVTFLVGSFAAIGATDAKKVLAYSTVANLGLIVLCGGIGTGEAVWAGLLLIVFHAVAKCLLFLCVGVVEHTLHSREIEAMSGLILRMPRVSVMMQIGMAGMFLAPFGMLISKWAVLKAVVDTMPLLTVFIVYGSAATLFFWVKWMGKLLEVVQPHAAQERDVTGHEWMALYGLAGLTFGTCLFFPFLSARFIEPYVADIFGRSVTMAYGNWTIMTLMLAVIALFPLSFLNYGRRVRVTDAYLGGANVQSSLRFRGAVGAVHEVSMKNYRLDGIFGEARLLRWGVLSGIVLMAALLVAAVVGVACL
jgi:ech hydrogenase subunit A